MEFESKQAHKSNSSKNHIVCCDNSYIQGQVIEIQSLQHFQGMNFHSPQKFDKQLVRKLKPTICSFANSQGGCILLGCNQLKPIGYQLQGIILDQCQRQQIKKVFNRIGNNFFPALSITKRQLQVNFVPMTNSVKKQFVPGLCVIRIRVCPQIKKFYCYNTLDQGRLNMMFYIRDGGVNRRLNDFKQIQQIILARNKLLQKNLNKNCKLMINEGSLLFRKPKQHFIEQIKDVLISQSLCIKGIKRLNNQNNYKKINKKKIQSIDQDELILISEQENEQQQRNECKPFIDWDELIKKKQIKSYFQQPQFISY